MEIDAATFHAITNRILPATSLSAAETTALVHTAQIAGGVDLDEDASERTMRRQLERYVCTIAGIDPTSVAPASPLPIDDEERVAWAARLASALRSPGVDELAYVIAYLVTVADLQLAPVESTFVEQLREALEIDRARANDLITTVSSMITPGVGSEARA